MTTDTFYVADGWDDAEERRDDAEFNASNNLVDTIRSSAGNEYDGGFRFPNITPDGNAGDTITAASVHVNVYSTSYDDPHLDIYAHAHDNSPDFETDGDIENRTLGSYYTTWDETGIGSGWQEKSLDVNIIQEAIDRPGFSSGNAVMLIFRAHTGDLARFYIEAYDFGEGTEAYLELTWTSAAVGQPYISRVQRVAGMRSWGGISSMSKRMPPLKPRVF